MPAFVYVLLTENPRGRPRTYVGWTLDLERRLAEHNGKAAGAKTTGRFKDGWFYPGDMGRVAADRMLTRAREDA